MDFLWENGLLSVFCDCAAGEWGKFCKHKWRLLSGDASMLYSEGDIDKLQGIEAWVKESSFSTLYRDVDALEEEIKTLKAEVKVAKKEAEKKLREGF